MSKRESIKVKGCQWDLIFPYSWQKFLWIVSKIGQWFRYLDDCFILLEGSMDDANLILDIISNIAKYKETHN